MKHAVSDQPDILQDIIRSDVNLSLWRRPIHPAVSRELSSLQASYLPDRRHPTSPASFDDDVASRLSERGLDPSAFTDLREDLLKLATHFFNITRTDNAVFRLFTSGADDCRRGNET